MNYLDFDLLLEPSQQGYRACVVHSPAGEGAAEFRLPFSAEDLKTFRLEIGQARRAVRRMESTEMRAAREFGARLFEAVFAGEVQERLRKSLEEIKPEGPSLRLRVHLSKAPELADVPWEYLYDPSLGRFFALSVKTPLVRYLDLPEGIKPLPVKPPVRVLVVIASPKDRPHLDVEAEWSKLSAALSNLTQFGMVELDRLEGGTYDALLKKLRRRQYHIFHFIGHGEFNDEVKEGMLLFEDEKGLGAPIPAQALGVLLHDEPTLRLAILNACEGARSTSSDPFAGTAQTLLRQGIPAVIAMQFDITDDAAQSFARTFYEAVADGYPVDAALTDARKNIFGEGSVEFATPVLYMRSPDGRIFDVDQRLSAEVRRRQQISSLSREASEAAGKEDWEKAVESLQNLVRMDPENQDAAGKLQEALRRREIAILWTSGLEHAEAKRWSEALEDLQAVQKLAGNFKDVEARISEIRGEIAKNDGKPLPSIDSETLWKDLARIADLYHEARKALAAEDWSGAIERCEGVLELDPKHAEAAADLQHARRQRELVGLLVRARESLDAGRWREAFRDLRQLREAGGGFQEIEALLARAGDLQRQEERRRKSRGLSLSWKAGGCVGAATVSLSLVLVAGLILLQRRSQPTTAEAARRAEESRPIRPMAGRPAEAAGEAGWIRPGAPARHAVESAIRNATNAEIQAMHYLNPAPLYVVYTNGALTGSLTALEALRARGEHVAAKLEDLEVSSVELSPDGLRATAQVVKTWTFQFHSAIDDACLREVPSHQAKQTYFLSLARPAWVVTEIQHHSEPPPPEPCANDE